MPKRPDSEPTRRPPRREAQLVSQVMNDFAAQVAEGLVDTRQLQDYVRYYQHLALKVLQVADIDARQAAERDEHQIAQFQELVSQLSELPLAEVQNVAQDLLRFIRAPQAEHSVFGKVLSTILLADVFVHLVMEKKYQSFSLVPSFKVSVENLSSRTEKLVLFSAFQARIKHQVARYPKISAVLHQSLPQTSHLREPQLIENEVAIRTLATLYERLIASEDVRLRMSVAALTESNSETQQGGHSEEGYPQTIMYLSPGHLPTSKKLFEALCYGIPENSMLSQRLPRILLGVPARTTDPTARLYLDQDHRLNVARLKFYHVNLAPVRQLERSAGTRDYLAQPEFYSDETAAQKVGFDSLSFILSGMISRHLRKNLKAIQAEILAEQNEKGLSDAQVDTLIERRLLGHFERILQAWLERFQVTMHRQHAAPNSIAGLAHEEYQRTHTSSETVQSVIQHLDHNVRLLVLKYQAQHWRVRNLDEIEALYKKHVFEHELSTTDKLALALFMFSDPACELWFHPLLDDDARWEIEQAITVSNPEFIQTTQLRELLIDLAREHFQVRAETIRDTTDPFRDVPMEEARE